MALLLTVTASLQVIRAVSVRHQEKCSFISPPSVYKKSGVPPCSRTSVSVKSSELTDGHQQSGTSNVTGQPNGASSVYALPSVGHGFKYCDGFAQSIKLWSQKSPLLGKHVQRNTGPKILERCFLFGTCQEGC
jgi:hypothetical protein